MQSELKALRHDFRQFLQTFNETQKGWAAPILKDHNKPTDPVDAIREALVDEVSHAKEEFENLHASMGFSPLDALLGDGAVGSGEGSGVGGTGGGKSKRTQRESDPQSSPSFAVPMEDQASSARAAASTRVKSVLGETYDYGEVKKLLRHLECLSNEMAAGPYLPVEVSSPYQPPASSHVDENSSFDEFLSTKRIRSKVNEIIEQVNSGQPIPSEPSRTKARPTLPRSQAPPPASERPSARSLSPFAMSNGPLEANTLQWKIWSRMEMARSADPDAHQITPKPRKRTQRQKPHVETGRVKKPPPSEGPAPISTKTPRQSERAPASRSPTRPSSPLRPPNFYNVRLSNAPIFLRRTTIRPPSLEFLDRRGSPDTR
ncbi:hypothetical protein HK097_009595, partial [Rhizophlyctis rosea]